MRQGRLTGPARSTPSRRGRSCAEVDVDYTGYEVLYDTDGDYAATRAVTGGDSDGSLLPALHVRYSLTPETNLRAAYTGTLSRPNYYDLVPYQLVFQEDGEISRGNAALKPTTSQNLDLMAEHYFRTVGIVSGGVSTSG